MVNTLFIDMPMGMGNFYILATRSHPIHVPRGPTIPAVDVDLNGTNVPDLYQGFSDDDRTRRVY